MFLAVELWKQEKQTMSLFNLTFNPGEFTIETHVTNENPILTLPKSRRNVQPRHRPTKKTQRLLYNVRKTLIAKYGEEKTKFDFYYNLRWLLNQPPEFFGARGKGASCAREVIRKFVHSEILFKKELAKEGIFVENFSWCSPLERLWRDLPPPFDRTNRLHLISLVSLAQFMGSCQVSNHYTGQSQLGLPNFLIGVA